MVRLDVESDRGQARRRVRPWSGRMRSPITVRSDAEFDHGQAGRGVRPWSGRTRSPSMVRPDPESGHGQAGRGVQLDRGQLSTVLRAAMAEFWLSIATGLWHWRAKSDHCHLQSGRQLASVRPNSESDPSPAKFWSNCGRQRLDFSLPSPQAHGAGEPKFGRFLLGFTGPNWFIMSLAMMNHRWKRWRQRGRAQSRKKE